VAGLIGASGGLRGVAPGALIHPYRVFPANGDGATNYAILKAMIYAGWAQCDIVNLSLGGGPYDDIVAEAIQDARNQGMLVVIAAGNDGRSAVSYPAAYAGALAVSAMGREGTFPAGSLHEAEVQRPPHRSGLVASLMGCPRAWATISSAIAPLPPQGVARRGSRRSRPVERVTPHATPGARVLTPG
jgi:subtilisin